MSVGRLSVYSKALAVGRILFILLGITLVVVTLTLVGLGHALARACEADCDMSVGRYKQG